MYILSRRVSIFDRTGARKTACTAGGWKLLSHNEERGKMTLSLLMFSVAVDPDNKPAKKFDMNYSIMNYYHTLVKEYNRELGIDPLKPYALRNTSRQQEKDLVVQSVIVTIQAIRHGTWHALSPVNHDRGSGLGTSDECFDPENID